MVVWREPFKPPVSPYKNSKARDANVTRADNPFFRQFDKQSLKIQSIHQTFFFP